MSFETPKTSQLSAHPSEMAVVADTWIEELVATEGVVRRTAQEGRLELNREVRERLEKAGLQVRNVDTDGVVSKLALQGKLRRWHDPAKRYHWTLGLLPEHHQPLHGWVHKTELICQMS
eukprot:EG_transcript_42235